MPSMNCGEVRNEIRCLGVNDDKAITAISYSSGILNKNVKLDEAK